MIIDTDKLQRQYPYFISMGNRDVWSDMIHNPSVQADAVPKERIQDILEHTDPDKLKEALQDLLAKPVQEENLEEGFEEEDDYER